MLKTHTFIKNVTVGLPGDDVASTSVDAPSTMKTNSKIKVTITVQNMGRNTWFENDSVQLGIIYEPNDSTQFTKITRLHMNPDSAVFTGKTCTWKFPLTAPSSPTKYNVTFRMIRDQEWFGNSVNRTVIITN